MLDKTKIEWSIWSDCFALMKKHYDINDNISGWDKLCGDAASLCEKYRGNDFCKDMTICLVSQLERRASSKRLLTSEKGA